MDYKTDNATGVLIVILPENHRHYAINVEYNKAKLEGNTPKLYWRDPRLLGSNWMEHHLYPLWDAALDYEISQQFEYEDREIILYNRYQERNYKEVRILVKNAMTFESSYKFARNKPGDTPAYIISIHPHTAFVNTTSWLKSLFAPVDHYIVFDNKEDFENAIKTFENSGRSLRVL